MTLLWIFTVIILASLNISQYKMKKHQNRNLKYITEKLNVMLKEHSADQILLGTDDKALRALLVQINLFTEDHQHITARFAKTEQSMKRMLTNMSHDLKTPLTVVLGYIEAIQSGSDMTEEERERLLEKVHQKTGEIIRLMNSFFDLAKLESEDKQMLLTKIHINEICRKNILQHYDAVQAKGFKAVIDIPDTPVYAHGDEEALDRILQNLLSNAIQYGADGKLIGLSLTYDDTRTVITVWDRGKGISEHDQQRVFERLYTLEESRNKAFQGSGLGLTITKRLVEKMGGEISLQSKPYEQTAFSITLKRMTY
ncbi:HAMP domain-containing histidine kinase [Bacillus swezeyi]|uniref:histidine kinase n=1 Tax=Bacillus swezeyi TaxID=1925020 RepID=A0A1R1S393_9BACI|nr:HAMP domain-containing histidine kinase [Bacillus swezeyi]MEC1260256.1 HAMP domain-containing histidine kinase [Bacillus swezeyi]MED1738627.1 HAMP domain-containing histidine kinase [Bacillus swezeyi]MED2929863.1 HAMP domain-containing histidine kinase [Bacillus swezeyi]MED2942785.1 HAMP domain-containing histidine kinase [Bacillus swezeyi]MED2964723.1 HAMP domain-containing histidine kinase [Bacillus swezeyi]